MVTYAGCLRLLTSENRIFCFMANCSCKLEFGMRIVTTYEGVRNTRSYIRLRNFYQCSVSLRLCSCFQSRRFEFEKVTNVFMTTLIFFEILIIFIICESLPIPRTFGIDVNLTLSR